jgi:hypothetical protein
VIWQVTNDDIARWCVFLVFSGSRTLFLERLVGCVARGDIAGDQNGRGLLATNYDVLNSYDKGTAGIGRFARTTPRFGKWDNSLQFLLRNFIQLTKLRKLVESIGVWIYECLGMPVANETSNLGNSEGGRYCMVIAQQGMELFFGSKTFATPRAADMEISRLATNDGSNTGPHCPFNIKESRGCSEEVDGRVSGMIDSCREV